MEILDKQMPPGHPDAERMQPIIQEYRERVLGKTCLKSAPDGYWEIGLALELKIPLDTWREYPLKSRAEIMARQYLSTMVETINREYQAQDDNREKQARDAEAKRKGK